MSRQPEGIIKDSCRRLAKANGLLFVNIESKGVNGMLDTLCGTTERDGVVLVEFKTPNGVLSEQQKRRMKELIEAGQRVAVCRSVEDYKRVVGLL